MPEDDLAFVVNARSGGRRGRDLLADLRRHFPADRVLDLHQGDLLAAVQAWRGSCRAVVACGGDGTVAAVLEAVGSDTQVAVGIIPLGTGNDLARHARVDLGLPWRTQVDRLRAAEPHRLDRWRLRGPGLDRIWYNYASFGGDARAAGRFHRWRDDHPGIFRSVAVNRLAYAAAGLQDLGAAVDGTLVAGSTRRLDVAACLFLNIPSYAGGQLRPAGTRADDGLCDVFAFPRGLGLGLALSGLRQARCLERGGRLIFQVHRSTFLQIDGEPRLARAGRYLIRSEGSVRLLMHPPDQGSIDAGL